jgi:hypothetical protein
MDALPPTRQQKHISGTEKYTNMGLDEVSTAIHAHCITLAKDGSREAAAILMSDAAICIQHGIPLPEPLGRYICEALYRAASINAPGGIDANTAFHLNKKRGRNKYIEVFSAHLICMEVQLAWLELGFYDATASGPGAYDTVADQYGYTDSRSVARLFHKPDRAWCVKEKTREELQADIAMYRKLLKK